MDFHDNFFRQRMNGSNSEPQPLPPQPAPSMPHHQPHPAQHHMEPPQPMPHGVDSMDAMAGQRHHTGSYASGVNTVGASKGSQPQVYAQPHPQHGQHMIPGNNNPLRPMPVVKVLSPMGVEYAFLTLTLLIGAGALISVLMVLVNGVSFSALSFGVSTLLVTLPLFAWLFLRLKKMELQNPELRLDPSKRRSTQTVQIISFLVSLFTLIAWVYTIMASFGGDNVVSVGKITLNVLCILVVSVGILAYYWHDEHRSNRKGW